MHVYIQSLLLKLYLCELDICYQIADQLLATSHMPGKKTRIPNFQGDYHLIAKFVLLQSSAASTHSQLYKHIYIGEKEREMNKH